jgi:hypothetical protein
LRQGIFRGRRLVYPFFAGPWIDSPHLACGALGITIAELLTTDYADEHGWIPSLSRSALIDDGWRNTRLHAGFLANLCG